MLGKSFLAVAALGIVSLWYLRSRAQSVSDLLSGAGAGASRSQVSPDDSPNAAERLQHSHALGVRNGIEGPVGADPDSDASGSPAPGDATFPGSREFMRGA